MHLLAGRTSLPAGVGLFFDGLVVMLARAGQRVKLVEDELVAVGVEGGNYAYFV